MRARSYFTIAATWGDAIPSDQLRVSHNITLIMTRITPVQAARETWHKELRRAGAMS